ncbi:MAG: phosphopantetheine-binding protein [Georgfuchsia sp.]
MDALSTIREFLLAHLDVAPERVVPDALLKDLGIDSLMMLELIFECEERLHIKIDPDTATPATIGEMISVFEQIPRAVN